MKLVTESNDVNGVLKQVLAKVEDPTTKLEQLDQMVEVMRENNGIGLCANQVGITESMFIYTNNKGKVEYVINPEIIKTGKRVAMRSEGCLSYPGKQVQVSRPVEIKVRYHNGRVLITKTLKGLEARCWMHEYDHCMGECIVGK